MIQVKRLGPVAFLVAIGLVTLITFALRPAKNPKVDPVDCEALVGMVMIDSEIGRDYIRVAIAKGTSVNCLRASDGLSALHVAAMLGQTGMISYLLGLGANPSIAERSGLTPLDLACRESKLDAVWILIQSGAQVNSATSHGFTPLHFAAAGGNTDVIQALLDAGADPNAKDMFGRTPGAEAERYGHRICAELIDRSASTSRPK